MRVNQWTVIAVCILSQFVVQFCVKFTSDELSMHSHLLRVCVCVCVCVRVCDTRICSYAHRVPIIQQNSVKEIKENGTAKPYMHDMKRKNPFLCHLYANIDKIILSFYNVRIFVLCRP